MSHPPVRRATPDDVDALVELRVVMESTFWDEVPLGPWRDTCRTLFEQRLRASDFAAFVVDGPDGAPVTSGVGWINQHLPSPGNPTGRVGCIASMSTRPEHRGRGNAKAVLAALMGWFASMGVDRITLTASPMGEPLYRSAGFTDPHEPVLWWRKPRRT